MNIFTNIAEAINQRKIRMCQQNLLCTTRIQDPKKILQIKTNTSHIYICRPTSRTNYQTPGCIYTNHKRNSMEMHEFIHPLLTKIPKAVATDIGDDIFNVQS